MSKYFKALILTLMSFFFIIACSKKNPSHYPYYLNNFAINGFQGSFSYDSNYIKVKVLHGTDINNAIATFETNGDRVTIGGVEQISGKTVNNFNKPLIYTVHGSKGESVTYRVEVEVEKNSANKITKFSLNGTEASIIGNKIDILLPNKINLASLAAEFKTTGVSVEISGVKQVSGITTNDFNKILTYKVTAENGDQFLYEVSVAFVKNPNKSITKFTLNDKYQGRILDDSSTIKVTVPAGINLNSLTAKFETTGESVLVNNHPQVSGRTSNDFTHPVTYTVEAEDKSRLNYVVTVEVLTLKEFSLNGIKGIIRNNLVENSVLVIMPYETPLTNLIATFISTGKEVKIGTTLQQNGVTSNNFNDSKSLTYTLVANDGTTAEYKVIVEQLRFKSFSINNRIGKIEGKSIKILMPFQTDTKNFTATFETTANHVKIGNNIQKSNVTPNDFSQPVTYTLTAENGIEEQYIVTVEREPGITKFSLAGTEGTILEKSILILLPKGTDLKNLTATFEAIGDLVKVGNVTQISGKTPNDFSSELTYKVIGSDKKEIDYIVNVATLKEYRFLREDSIVELCQVNSDNKLIKCEYLSKTTSSKFLTKLAVANNFAYVIKKNEKNIETILCKVNKTNGKLTDCKIKDYGFTHPHHMTISTDNKFAYIANGIDEKSTITVCSIKNALGELSECREAAEKKDDQIYFFNPINITFSNNFAYILNNIDDKRKSVTICKVESSTGKFSACQITENNSLNLTKYAKSIQHFNNFIYFLGKYFTICEVNQLTGAPSHCKITNNDKIINNFIYKGKAFISESINSHKNIRTCTINDKTGEIFSCNDFIEGLNLLSNYFIQDDYLYDFNDLGYYICPLDKKRECDFIDFTSILPNS